MKKYDLIVMGSSLGGLKAFTTIFSALHRDFLPAVAVVQHIGSEAGSNLAELLSRDCAIPVKEAEDKESIRPGTVYIAPAGYHLLVERDGSFSLSVDEKENHSRPSINVLFESAADALGASVAGVILTGFNADGAAGLAKIHQRGGYTIVQDPASAEAGEMPRAALKVVVPDVVLALEKIGPFLNSLSVEANS